MISLIVISIVKSVRRLHMSLPNPLAHRIVERTKARPIAAGKISVRGAVIFLWCHLGIMLWMVRDVNALACVLLLRAALLLIPI
jgi:heme O synthase-like polyprenyltransferase